jgi:hypothetical protein
VSIALFTVALAACATALPPAVKVTDIRPLAGTYSGTTKEDGELARSTRFVLQPDGKFELAASDPRGFRVLGEMRLDPDGTLSYEYGEQRGGGQAAKGRVAVHEGGGERSLVLTKNDGTMTTRVSKSVP